MLSRSHSQASSVYPLSRDDVVADCGKILEAADEEEVFSSVADVPRRNR